MIRENSTDASFSRDVEDLPRPRPSHGRRTRRAREQGRGGSKRVDGGCGWRVWTQGPMWLAWKMQKRDVRGWNLPNAMSPLTHKESQVRWRRLLSTRRSNGLKRVPMSLAMRMGANHAQHTTKRWNPKREVVFHTTRIYTRAIFRHNAADIFPCVDSA